MEHHRQDRVARIFQAALDREPSQRESFLHEACGGDESLRKEIESLLCSHDSAGSFLETLPLEMASEAIAAEHATSLIGRRIGSFEIVSLVGFGGMGEVYCATDTRLGRTVAIKFLPTHFSSKPEWRQRLEREALAISRLNHPNICTLYDIGRHEDMDYLVLEYLEGETLEHRLARGPLLLDETLRYGVQIADALNAAHRQHVTHRDIKPANIMLIGNSCKLLDFGLAKLHVPVVSAAGSSSARSVKNQTAEGTILGTIQYMAPEQLEGNAADDRTDIFSFGAVLYEMITGQKAFQGNSHASLIAAIMLATPTPISILQPSPRALDHLVQQCLARNPDERWQTVQDVGKELQQILESEAGLLSAGRSTSALFAKSSRRTWIVAAISSVAGLAGGFLLLRRNSEPAAEEFESDGRYAINLPDGAALGFDREYGGPAVSPDGSSVVLAVARNGRVHLYLRTRYDLEMRLLEGTERGHHPFWNPNGQEVGFFADGYLKTVSTVSGQSQTLCVVSLPSDNQGKGGSWNTFGDVIFAGRNRSPLFRVRISNPVRQDLTTLDKSMGEGRHCWPCFLPDQRKFLYLAWMPDQRRGAVYAGSLDSEMKKPILDDQDSSVIYAAEHLLYVKNHRLMARPFDPDRLEFKGGERILEKGPVATTGDFFGNPLRACFSAGEKVFLVFYGERRSRLVRYDREGSLKIDVGVRGLERYDSLRLSQDGEKLFYGAVPSEPLPSENSILRILDLKQERTDSFNGEGASLPLVFSPDSRQAFFMATEKPNTGGRDVSRSIYRIVLTPDSKPQKIVTDKDHRFDFIPLDCSHDGRFLLILRTERKADARGHLWLARFTREGNVADPTPLDDQTAFTTKEGRFSPKGLKNLWIAYTSDEDGGDQVYVRAVPPADKKFPISKFGGNFPVWTKGGQEIVFLQGNVLMAAPIKEVDSEIQVGPIARLPFALPNTNLMWLPWWDATPDGRYFYAIESLPTPITVVDNWSARLKI